MQTNNVTGWWNPTPWKDTKFHYIGKDGRSLCKKWLYWKGLLENGLDDHPSNCAICRKRKAQIDKKEKKY